MKNYVLAGVLMLAVAFPSLASATVVTFSDNTVYSSECIEGGEALFVFTPADVGNDGGAVLYPEVLCGTPFTLPDTVLPGQVVHVGVASYHSLYGVEAGVTMFSHLDDLSLQWRCENTAWLECPFDFYL